MKFNVLHPLCSMVAFCFTTTAVAQTTITVSASGNPQNMTMFETLITEFNAQSQQVEVDWQPGPRETSEFIQQLLRDSLVGSELPDVILFTGPILRTLHDRGLVSPIYDLIATDTEWNAVVTSSMMQPAQVDGETAGVAFGMSMPVVVFNSELVRQVGGDPDNLPTTWDGILELAEQINDLGPEIVGGFLEHDNSMALSWLALLESHGGRIMTADNTSFTFNSPEGLQALEVLRRFGEAGQAASDMTRDQARQAFGAGGIGVLVTMSSLLSRYEREAEDRFQVRAVPYPVVDGTGMLPASSVIGSILTADEVQQRASLEFVRFVADVPGQTILVQQTGYAPSSPIAVESAGELAGLLAQRANAASYLEHQDVISGWYVVPGEQGLRIARVFMDGLQRVVTLEQAPQDALDSMERDAQSIFN